VVAGGIAVASLDQLFALEIEFHRKLRAEAPGTAEAASLHTSYALQSGYEQLLRAIVRVTARDITQMTQGFLASSDPRDVLRARDSVARLLGVRMFEP
jgi:hypothetical protein